MLPVIKRVLIFSILAVTMTLVSCSKNEKVEKLNQQESAEVYGKQIVALNSSLENFIVKTQAYESANFDRLSVADLRRIIGEYVDAGEQFVEALEYMAEVQPTLSTRSAATRGAIDEAVCFAYDFCGTDSGVSVGTAMSVAEMVGETSEGMKQIEANYEKNAAENVDEANITFVEESKEFRNKQLKKAVSFGGSAVIGTGAALVTGAALSVVAAPMAVVMGVSAVVGTGVTWFVNWYSDGTRAGGGVHYMTTGKTTIGGELPLHLIPEGATLSMQVDGYAPVVIKNFEHPEAGYERTLNLELAELNEVENGSLQYCILDTPAEADSCDDVRFVNGTPSPIDPAPGQAVDLTATLIPAVPGCMIYFNIIGTDGFAVDTYEPADANGQASIRIPGGMEDVFDKITIRSSNGKQYIVTYTF